jgi:hypothetical protein
MRTIELSWETWRAVIAVLREKAVPYMPEHANLIKEQLERHGPDEATVRLSLTDDVFLRSSSWARWQLGSRCRWTGEGEPQFSRAKSVSAVS